MGRQFYLFNTACRIVLPDPPASANDILDECETLARDVMAMLDAYDPTSELGRLNRLNRPGEPWKVSARLYALLRRMDRFSVACGGAYDATVRPLVELWDFTAANPAVPDDTAIAKAQARCGYQRVCYDDSAGTVTFAVPGMSIDAGGVGKGYAAGLVADYLRKAGVRSASIDFGGELYLLGRNGSRDDGLWRVGIQQPWAGPGETAGSLMLCGGAVASSGAYERYFVADGGTWCHILDPRTGRPAAHRLQSVTVVGGDPVMAEMASTAFFVLGVEAGDMLLNVPGMERLSYLAITDDGITLSDGLSGQFRPAPNNTRKEGSVYA